MRNNILLLSNFNLFPSSAIWQNDISKNNLFFDNIYDSNFLALKKLDNRKITVVFMIIYFNDFLNIDYLKAIIFFLKIIKKKKHIGFHFFFLKKNLDNIIIDKNITSKFVKVLALVEKSKLENLNYSIIQNDSEKYFNLRNEFLLKMPLEYSYLKKISKRIFKISKIKNNPYKIIFLDCDNTLWGGVSAEEGYSSVEYSTGDLGFVYEKFQKYLLNLKNQGFLLTLISKNNEKIVWQTFQNRNMLLKKKDFIFPQINWNDKSKNILNVLNFLNLRAEDAIFIDDSEFELLKVKKKIINIELICSKDIIKCYEEVISHPRLQKKIISEDLKKNKQYLLRNNFLELKKDSINDSKIFKKLNQKIYFEEINNKNLSRAEQLYNKTNQFNFSVNRRNIDNILSLKKKKEIKIRLFGLKDSYGDHGLVGLYCLKKNFDQNILVDYILSCRVFERYIEYYIINNIFLENKLKHLIINFNITESNIIHINKFLSIFSKSKKFKHLGKNDFKIEYNENLMNYLKYFKKK